MSLIGSVHPCFCPCGTDGTQAQNPADIFITGQVTQVPEEAGDQVTICFSAYNAGPAPVYNAEIQLPGNLFPAAFNWQSINASASGVAIAPLALSLANVIAGGSIIIPYLPVGAGQGAVTFCLSGVATGNTIYTLPSTVAMPGAAIDTNPANNQAQVVIDLRPRLVDILVTKTASAQSVSELQLFTWTLQIQQLPGGIGNAQNVTVTDVLPTGFVPTTITVSNSFTGVTTTITQAQLAVGYNLGTISPTAGATVTIAGSMQALETDSVVNGAAVTTTTTENVVVNNQSTVLITACCLQLSVEQVSSPAPNQAVIAAVITNICTNQAQPAGSVTFDVPPPLGWSPTLTLPYAAIPPGGSQTVQLTVENPETENPVLATISAQANGQQTCPPGNFTVVSLDPAPPCNLQFDTLTVFDNPLTPGSTTAVEVFVRAVGPLPGAAGSATLFNLPPGVTYDGPQAWAALPPGGFQVLVFNVTNNVSTTLTNHPISVLAGGTCPPALGFTMTFEAPVSQFLITKTGPTSEQSDTGAGGGYVIYVENTSGTDLSGAVVNDVLPAQFVPSFGPPLGSTVVEFYGGAAVIDATPAEITATFAVLTPARLFQLSSGYTINPWPAGGAVRFVIPGSFLNQGGPYQVTNTAGVSGGQVSNTITTDVDSPVGTPTLSGYYDYTSVAPGVPDYQDADFTSVQSMMINPVASGAQMVYTFFFGPAVDFLYDTGAPGPMSANASTGDPTFMSTPPFFGPYRAAIKVLNNVPGTITVDASSSNLTKNGGVFDPVTGNGFGGGFTTSVVGDVIFIDFNTYVGWSGTNGQELNGQYVLTVSHSTAGVLGSVQINFEQI